MRVAAGDQIVGRSERVEQMITVGQQVLPARLADSDCVRENPQRKSLRQGGHCIEPILGDDLIDQFVGIRCPFVV